MENERVLPKKTIKYAGVAELADAQDLGSCVNSCRFKSCHPHQTKTVRNSVPFLFGLSNSLAETAQFAEFRT